MTLGSTTITTTVSAFHSRNGFIEVFFGMLPSSHKIMLDHPAFEQIMGDLSHAYKSKSQVKVTYSIDMTVSALEPVE